MNEHDPFEQRLRRQSLRQVPHSWRERILAAADVNRQTGTAPSASRDQAELIAGWRLLFGRLPLAWASLAALWIVMVGVNLTLPAAFVSVAALGAPSVGLESLAALDFSAAELKSPANEFAPASDAAPVPNQPAAPLRPQSDRRRETDTGQTRSGFPFATIA